MSKGYEQRKAANERYLATQDEIKIRVPKGTKERWRAAAEEAGLSLQKFIIAAVEAAAPQVAYTPDQEDPHQYSSEPTE